MVVIRAFLVLFLSISKGSSMFRDTFLKVEQKTTFKNVTNAEKEKC